MARGLAPSRQWSQASLGTRMDGASSRSLFGWPARFDHPMFLRLGARYQYQLNLHTTTHLPKLASWICRCVGVDPMPRGRPDLRSLSRADYSLFTAKASAQDSYPCWSHFGVSTRCYIPARPTPRCMTPEKDEASLEKLVQVVSLERWKRRGAISELIK